MLALAGCLLAGACKQATTIPASESKTVHVTPEVIKPLAKDVMLQDLLRQAEVAFDRGRLTVPSEDNAYDKFLAATLLDPGNARARAGLDGVLLTLVAMARDELAKGRLQKTGQIYNTLAERFPSSPLTKEVQNDLRGTIAAREAARSKLQQALAEDSSQHLVPEKFAAGKTEDAKAWFAQLAQEIQKKDASVMIYARSDSEGRRFYRLLKDGAPGYLIRGDIRVNSLPRIELLEPLP